MCNLTSHLLCTQPFQQRIFLSDSDYQGIADALGLKDEQMSPHDFERLMREQLKLYTQSRLSSMSEFWAITEQDFTTIGALKYLLMEQIKLRKEVSAMSGSSTGANLRRGLYSEKNPNTKDKGSQRAAARFHGEDETDTEEQSRQDLLDALVHRHHQDLQQLLASFSQNRRGSTPRLSVARESDLHSRAGSRLSPREVPLPPLRLQSVRSSGSPVSVRSPRSETPRRKRSKSQAVAGPPKPHDDAEATEVEGARLLSGRGAEGMPRSFKDGGGPVDADRGPRTLQGAGIFAREGGAAEAGVAGDVDQRDNGLDDSLTVTGREALDPHGDYGPAEASLSSTVSSPRDRGGGKGRPSLKEQRSCRRVSVKGAGTPSPERSLVAQLAFAKAGHSESERSPQAPTDAGLAAQMTGVGSLSPHAAAEEEAGCTEPVTEGAGNVGGSKRRASSGVLLRKRPPALFTTEPGRETAGSTALFSHSRGEGRPLSARGADAASAKAP
jgi:hypothetical protein